MVILAEGWVALGAAMPCPESAGTFTEGRVLSFIVSSSAAAPITDGASDAQIRVRVGHSLNVEA
jgi:hypothetical protein